MRQGTNDASGAVALCYEAHGLPEVQPFSLAHAFLGSRLARLFGLNAPNWRETEIAPDGTRKKVLRYEALGEVTRKVASDTLSQKRAAAGARTAPMRSRVTFRTLASEWDASVVPMYKHSTQIHRRFMLKKHLLPQVEDAKDDQDRCAPQHADGVLVVAGRVLVALGLGQRPRIGPGIALTTPWASRDS
jgi:hypothetical protein